MKVSEQFVENKLSYKLLNIDSFRQLDLHEKIEFSLIFITLNMILVHENDEDWKGRRRKAVD